MCPSGSFESRNVLATRNVLASSAACVKAVIALALCIMVYQCQYHYVVIGLAETLCMWVYASTVYSALVVITATYTEQFFSMSGGWHSDVRLCAVIQIDVESNEIAGVFESVQPSDTDLGSKAPKDVKIIGLW